MPELPEVQTVVENLNALGIGGSTITKASVHWPRTIAPVTPARFRQQIKGLRINGFSRRGKYIVVNLTHGWTLLIHLRMTGRLNWAATGTRRGKHEQCLPNYRNLNLKTLTRKERKYWPVPGTSKKKKI